MASRSATLPPRELTVGQIASRAGIPVSTVHFYEAEGLIRGWRTRANHRRYPRGVLRRIAIIRVAQRAGIPLKEIATALATLPEGRVPTAHDWAALSVQWKARLDDRIARLTRLRDQMAGCIGCGCLSVSECPLRNPEDELARGGSGPRLLDPDPSEPAIPAPPAGRPRRSRNR